MILKFLATYLAWIDIKDLRIDSQKFVQDLRVKTGLILSAGDIYRGNGNQFIRLNYACPRRQLANGLTRLKKGVEYENS